MLAILLVAFDISPPAAAADDAAMIFAVDVILVALLLH